MQWNIYRHRNRRQLCCYAMLVEFVRLHLPVNNANTSSLHEIIFHCSWSVGDVFTAYQKQGGMFAALTSIAAFLKWSLFLFEDKNALSYLIVKTITKGVPKPFFGGGKIMKFYRKEKPRPPKFGRKVTDIMLCSHLIWPQSLESTPPLKWLLVKKHLKSSLTCPE